MYRKVCFIYFRVENSRKNKRETNACRDRLVGHPCALRDLHPRGCCRLRVKYNNLLPAIKTLKYNNNNSRNINSDLYYFGVRCP